MKLSVHLLVLGAIAAIAIVLCAVCRRIPARARTVRLVLGCAIAVNEIVWWVFRYRHEGLPPRISRCSFAT